MMRMMMVMPVLMVDGDYTDYDDDEHDDDE